MLRDMVGRCPCGRSLRNAMLWLLVLSAQALARDYYFSTQGDDTRGDGSRRAPFRTIAYLNSLDLEPGDRVLLRAGETFVGPILLDAADSASDPDGVLRHRPIRFLSYGGRARAIISSPDSNALHAIDAGGIRIRHLEFAGKSVAEAITDPANVACGLLFENRNSFIRQHRITIADVAVHGFGEAGIKFVAVNPAASTGGFADVRLLRSEIHSNGRSAVASAVQSASGTVADAALYDFQARAHASFVIRDNIMRHTLGKRESGGVSGSGIVLGQMARARIHFNVAHHNGGVAGGGGVAIWTWESDGVRIEFNEAYANGSFDGRDGGGFDLDGGARDGLLQYNYSHGNYGAGYGLFQFGYASAMQRNVIRYNVSEADGGGVAVWGNGPRYGGTDLAEASLLYNNTLIHPRGPAAHFFGSVSRVGVYNNIFLAGAAQDVVQLQDFDGAGPAYTVAVGMLANAYWSVGDGLRIVWDGQRYSSVTDWSAATQQETAEGLMLGVQAEPGLQGPFDGGQILAGPLRRSQLDAYRLQPGSPLEDAGISVASLALPVALGLTEIAGRDFYGDTAPHGRAFDIGAAER